MCVLQRYSLNQLTNRSLKKKKKKRKEIDKEVKVWQMPLYGYYAAKLGRTHHFWHMEIDRKSLKIMGNYLKFVMNLTSFDSKHKIQFPVYDFENLLKSGPDSIIEIDFMIFSVSFSSKSNIIKSLCLGALKWLR